MIFLLCKCKIHIFSVGEAVGNLIYLQLVGLYPFTSVFHSPSTFDKAILYLTCYHGDGNATDQTLNTGLNRPF